MAGFTNQNKKNKGFFSILSKISSFGMDIEDEIIKNSDTVGVIESEVNGNGYLPDEYLYALALADIGKKQFIAYYDKEFVQRQEYLRKFSTNSEIEFMLETIADETIVYDDSNFFCSPNTSRLETLLNKDVKEEIINYIQDSFLKIYSAFHFSEGHDAWSYLKQFLIDGVIVFEIIYNEDKDQIIGFKEIRPESIKPALIDTENGQKRGWIQNDESVSDKRELLDEQIIYISYAKENFVGKKSYVERMVRSFNLLRILENSRIIWHVMNSTYRLKMVVPIGSRSPQKAEESLKKFRAIFREDVKLDFDSGEISYNGKPEMKAYRNYMYPSKNGESVDIETLGGDGPDLNSVEALEYFYKKLIKDSKVPADRFDSGTTQSGEWTLGADGMSREEIRFARFIKRIRSMFQEILLKPLTMQIYLKYPDLAGDNLFKGALGLSFIEDNLFEELKFQEIMKTRVDFVNEMLDIEVTDFDEEGEPYEMSYFDPKLLTEEYLKLSPDFIKKNEEYIVRRKQKQKEILDNIKDDD